MVELKFEQVKEYYSRPEIADGIASFCEGREAVPVFNGGGVGKRPAVIQYPHDLSVLVKEGAVAFWCSLERWANPLLLKTEMKREEMDRLRLGWDIGIDIDCKKELAHAKAAALKVLEVVEQHGIKNYLIKFSGRRGFHIFLPFELFPQEYDGKPIKNLYPELPRMVTNYIHATVKKELKREFNGNLDSFLSFDNIVTQRHLFRAPYSLNEKTGLVSVYLAKDQIADFEPEQARPENVKVVQPQLNFNNGEAMKLLAAAKSWSQDKPQPVITASFIPKTKYRGWGINPSFFPPCIKNILCGLDEGNGRKRSVFILTTFLTNIGWKEEAIWRWVINWNKKNRPPLPENDLQATFKSQFKRAEPSMAPNCDNSNYYKDFGVCTPDDFCPLIKNPVTYAEKKSKTIKEMVQLKSYKGTPMICYNREHKVPYKWAIRKDYGMPARCPSCHDSRFIRHLKIGNNHGGNIKWETNRICAPS